MRQNTARKKVDGLPTMPSLVFEKNYCTVHMASLSLFDLIGLSFACTGKNGDLIARASRKTSVPVAVKVPSGRQSKWLLGKPFLAKKPSLDTEPSLHVQELLAPAYSSRSTARTDLCQVVMVSNCTVPRGVGSFTASARKNVDGLPTMPSLVLEENVLYNSYGKSFLV